MYFLLLTLPSADVLLKRAVPVRPRDAVSKVCPQMSVWHHVPKLHIGFFCCSWKNTLAQLYFSSAFLSPSLVYIILGIVITLWKAS